MIDFVQYKKIIENCYNIVMNKLYDDEKNNQPIACRLTEICDNSDTSHVCIACNLANDTDRLLNYLYTLEILNKNCGCNEEHIIHNFEIYFMILNLIIERVKFVEKILKIIDDKQIENKFIFDNGDNIFQKIRYWANFVKHPKEFMFVHHPYYIFSGIESIEEIINDNKIIMIDNKFVEDYYKQDDDKQKEQLQRKLGNKQNVIVNFPNFEEMTEKFCNAYNNFINMIIENPVYKYKLSSNCVIEDYWQDDENS